MLILKRRLDQTIMVGPDITITVIGIEAGAVVLGISAPRATQVIRQDAVDSAQEAAPDGPEPAPTPE